MARNFSEQQVAEIIKRAAEYQLRQRTFRRPLPDGMSEVELRSVAREVGISEEAIDNALSTIISVSQKDSGSLKSIKRVLVRTIDREISDEDLAVVTEEFVPLPGTAGAALKLGKSVQYGSVIGGSPCSVNVSRRNGKTEIRIKSNVGLGALPIAMALGISFLSIFAGAFEFGEAGDSMKGAVLVLFVPAAMILSGIWLSCTVVRSVNEKTLRALNDATARVIELNDKSSEGVAAQSQATEGPVEGDVQSRIQE